jgi:RHS repeat-associated protein
LSKNDGSLTTYTYDFENRLLRVQTPTNTLAYTYAADGVRISARLDGIVTNYLVDKNRDYSQVLEERDPIGTLLAAYTHGDDLISQERGGSKSYYHYDGLGSTRALTDSSEQLTDSYTYEAFGNLTRVTGATPNSFLFAGEQFDPNSGFYYLRARYMNPEIGRFVTMDTFKGHMTDPLSLHKYLYGNGNPVDNIDPSGQFSLGSISIGISVRGILSGIGRISFRGALQWVKRMLKGKVWKIHVGMYGLRKIIQNTVPHFFIYAERIRLNSGFRYDVGPNVRKDALSLGLGGFRAVSGYLRESIASRSTIRREGDLILPVPAPKLSLIGFYSWRVTIVWPYMAGLTYRLNSCGFSTESCLTWTAKAYAVALAYSLAM